MAEESIAARRGALERKMIPLRIEALRRVNAEHYDAERAKIVADCSKEGHVEGAFHNNGLGVSWYNCAKCNGRIESTVEVWRIDDDGSLKAGSSEEGSQ